jgi:hypothetical protein
VNFLEDELETLRGAGRNKFADLSLYLTARIDMQ